MQYTFFEKDVNYPFTLLNFARSLDENPSFIELFNEAVEFDAKIRINIIYSKYSPNYVVIEPAFYLPMPYITSILLPIAILQSQLNFLVYAIHQKKKLKIKKITKHDWKLGF